MAMIGAPRHALVLLLATALVTLCFRPTVLAKDLCAYTIYTRTGSIWRGGTASTISLTFADEKNSSIFIPNVTAWGGALQGPHYTHFERGALDIFSGLHNCLPYPICKINVTSDGEGSGAGWYLNYVEITSTGAHLACNQHQFEVERWIAYDQYPFSLEYTANECKKKSSHTESLSSVV